jgi:4-amino-4-deoxy-L-arabinose transferase-like glycosyltransferase
VDNLDLADRDRRMAYAPTSPAPSLPESRSDGGRLSDPAARVWLRAIAIVLASTIVRLVIATLTPVFPDETYYWEWSRPHRLAVGYFDHPPVIAWLIHAGTIVGGVTPLGVRLVPVLVGGLATLFLCATARRLAGNRAALLTAVSFAVMPLSAAGLILATPDAPMLAGVAATTYALVRALDQTVRTWRSMLWWCIAGIALGVALLSKYTAVLVPLGVFLAFLLRREQRVHLTDAGPYVATLLALGIFAPVIQWNAQHHWASFAFQLQHGFAPARGSILSREVELIGGQLGLVSPILFVLCTIAVVDALRSRTIRHAWPVLATIAAVVFAFFMYSATQRRVEANWPAIAYVPAVLLATPWRGSRWSSWFKAGILLAAILTSVTYVNAFTPILLSVPARRDPAARAAGWDDLARAVDRIYAPRLAISSHQTFVAAERYQEASELAFHLPNHPYAFALNFAGRPNQYDLWPSFPDRAHRRDVLILVVDESEGVHPTVALLTPHFASVQRGEVVALARNGDVVKRVRIWLLDGWLGTWPERPLRSRT